MNFIMSSLFWIAVVFIGLPCFVGAMIGIFSSASKPMDKVNPVYPVIFMVIGAIIILWAVPNFTNGIFSGLKNFCALVVKLTLGFGLVLIGITRLLVGAVRNNWAKKINRALNGALGDTISKYLIKNSLCYWVYADKIEFLDNRDNKKYYVSFNDIGYENIPADCANMVCQWISDNFVTNPGCYHIDEIYTEREEFVSGTPDTIRTYKTYDGGYESYHVSGSNDYRTVHETTGFRLVHDKLYYTNKKQNVTLNKW